MPSCPWIGQVGTTLHPLPFLLLDLSKASALLTPIRSAPGLLVPPLRSSCPLPPSFAALVSPLPALPLVPSMPPALLLGCAFCPLYPLRVGCCWCWWFSPSRCALLQVSPSWQCGILIKSSYLQTQVRKTEPQIRPETKFLLRLLSTNASFNLSLDAHRGQILSGRTRLRERKKKPQKEQRKRKLNVCLWYTVHLDIKTPSSQSLKWKRSSKFKNHDLP